MVPVWGDGARLSAARCCTRAAISAAVTGGTTVNNTPLWSHTPAAGLRVLAASGDPLLVRPGDAAAAYDFYYDANRNLDSHTTSLAEDGTLLVAASLVGRLALATFRADSVSVFPPRLSVVQGTRTQEIFIDARPQGSARSYLVLGSMSGTTPGIALGPYHLPLNPDGFLTLSASYANLVPFISTFGPLDSAGRATARIFVPIDLPFAGVRFDWSCLFFDAALNLVGAGASASLELYDG